MTAPPIIENDRPSPSMLQRPIAVAPAEAARLAGVGRTTLYAALKTGALPSLRLGRRRLIKLAALTAWLDGHGA